MKTFICTICGYVFTGKEPPEFCPQCKAPASKFQEQKTQGLVWADEHRIGVAAGVDPEIVEGLRQNFTGECTEVGMYLALSRQAKKNVELRAVAEHGACEGKKKLATRAKELGLDAIHDTVHEMCKDEARHGCAFQGLLNRYFGK